MAAATAWYEAFFDLRSGNFHEVLSNLHDKYGPIVRVNPTELSIRDADYYNEVYVQAGKRRTNLIPGVRAGLGMSDAISTTGPHELHQLRRKAVEGFFSKQSVTRLESRIHHEASVLDEGLFKQKKGVDIRLDHAFSCATGDLAGQFACGENPGLLEDPNFNPEWHNSLIGILSMVPIARNFPWINSEGNIEKVKAEVAKVEKDDDFDRRMSIFHSILLSDLPEPEKDSARLKREAFALLAAGTITTSGTLTIIVYYALANPEIGKRLTEDVREATAGYPEKMPRWADLEKIPYLMGCIKEGLRIGRFFRRNARISPDKELQYKQWTIPAGTPVGMSVCQMHMDPDVYPDPYAFKPERWIGDIDPRVNRNLVPFVKGSRMCLGLNLAWAEMYIILAVLFRPGGHKMTLGNCDETDIVPIYDSDVGVAKPDSRGLNIRLG
ncbi:MAG: hypothetical protein Q9220_005261 [cf. Caloplaca sp. 1 TL-2023]